MPQTLLEKFEKYAEIYKKRDDDEELVFLAAATIESLLLRILKKYLVLPKSEVDSLFDADRPLSGFGARIHLAYRTGLISEGLYDELHLLRHIRKQFKNTIDCGSLDYRDVLEFCQNLKAPISLKNRSDSVREDYPDTPRGNFELAVVIMSCILEDLLDTISPVSKSPFY